MEKDIVECRIKNVKTLESVIKNIKGYLDNGQLIEIKDREKYNERRANYITFDEIYTELFEGGGTIPDIVSLIFETPKHEIYVLGCECYHGNGGGFGKINKYETL